MSAQKYQWLRFWRLEREETFHIGKTCYVKLWFVLAIPSVCEHFLQFRVILPWTRVKTTRPCPYVIQTLTGKGPTVNVSTGSDTDAP